MNDFSENELKLPSGSIHYRLRGNTNPLFVFVYGGMGQIDQSTWDVIISLLPEELSILTFDRPGVGKSKKSDINRNAENICLEIKSLLDSLNFSKYILVGHSLGGLLVRYFACRFPEKVAGLILLDSTHEDQLTRGKKYYDPQMLKEGEKSFLNNPEGFVLPDDLDTSFAQIRAFKSLPQNIKTIVAVAGNSLPPQILNADKLNELNILLHRQLAETSFDSELYIVENCFHSFYVDQPDIVVNIIKSIL